MKTKILVIEDDPRQITWAKESLKDNELTIAQTGKEAESYDFKMFDIILTDLFLPDVINGKTSYKIGLKFFHEIVALVKTNQLKACALISNFEGHLNKGEIELSDVEYLSNERTKWYRSRGLYGDEKIDSRIDFFWREQFSSYDNLMSSDGKIHTREEIQTMREDGTLPEDGLRAELSACKNYGFVLLKPYGRIVDGFKF